MDEVGMILDVSHLTDESFHEGRSTVPGPVLASHSNCRALVPGDRQLDDDMIRRMIERDGVIGAVMDAWMLDPDWMRGETNENVTAGSGRRSHRPRLPARRQRPPRRHRHRPRRRLRHRADARDLDTIADVRRSRICFGSRGYGEEAITAVMHGNWSRLFEGRVADRVGAIR